MCHSGSEPYEASLNYAKTDLFSTGLISLPCSSYSFTLMNEGD